MSRDLNVECIFAKRTVVQVEKTIYEKALRQERAFG